MERARGWGGMTIRITNCGPVPLDEFNEESPNGYRIYEVSVLGRSLGKFVHKRDQPISQLFRAAAVALEALPGKRFDMSCTGCDGRGWVVRYVRHHGNARKWYKCRAPGCTATGMPKPAISPHAFDALDNPRPGGGVMYRRRRKTDQEPS